MGEQLALLVFGFVVFTVFGEVAEGARFLDHLCDLFLPDGLHPDHFLLEFFEPFGRQFYWICHTINTFLLMKLMRGMFWGGAAIAHAREPGR